jgi:Fe-S-cluster containining protein
MSDINIVCNKCISTGEVTCCSCKPWIPLTIDDVRRLRRICGFKEFCVAEEKREEDIVNFDEWRRNHLPVINGRFYMLCMRKTGNCCIFLNKGVGNGCVLRSERPVICKLYPLWINAEGKVIYEADDFCLFIKDNVPINETLRVLGEREEIAKNYFLNIKKDWIENNALHKKMLITLLQEVGENKRRLEPCGLP